MQDVASLDNSLFSGWKPGSILANPVLCLWRIGSSAAGSSSAYLSRFVLHNYAAACDGAPRSSRLDSIAPNADITSGMIDAVRKLRILLSPREQRQALLLLVLMVIGATLEMVGIGAIPAFVTLIGQPQRARTLPFVGNLLPRPSSDGTTALLVIVAALALLGLFLIKNCYAAMLLLAQSRYVSNRQVGIANRLFKAYLESPYTFHLQRNTAELLRNASNESFEVVGSVLMPGLVMSLEVLTIGAILLLLVAVEPVISLATFVLLGGVTVTFMRALRRRVIHFSQEMQQFRMEMIRTVNEGLGGVKLTKVLGREEHFSTAFRTQSARFANAMRFRTLMADIPRLYLETAAMVGLLGVATLLMAQRRSMESVIPTLSLLAVAVVRMIPSFNRITSSLTTMRYGRLSLDVVFADLGSLGALHNAGLPEPATPLAFEDSLQLRNVSYQYPGSARASVENVSVTISRGATVAFVGSTGAGKTTIVDVILGLLLPTEGQVLVDGRDIRSNVRGWQQRIGYVPQDTYLVDDSIRANIAFGLDEESIDDGALWRAAEAAQLGEFIRGLPDGMATIVGERGVRLSGGQRQRIGIARALYHSPDVLVFDEATSSLDNETERYVMEAVERLRGDRTIIMIAHRLSTVRACDELFLLSTGSLIAQGTYEELLGENVAFRRLAGAH